MAIAYGISCRLFCTVMPAQAGIQRQATGFAVLDSRLRGNDAKKESAGKPYAIALPNLRHGLAPKCRYFFARNFNGLKGMSTTKRNKTQQNATLTNLDDQASANPMLTFADLC